MGGEQPCVRRRSTVDRSTRSPADRARRMAAPLPHALTIRTRRRGARPRRRPGIDRAGPAAPCRALWPGPAARRDAHLDLDEGLPADPCAVTIRSPVAAATSPARRHAILARAPPPGRGERGQIRGGLGPMPPDDGRARSTAVDSATSAATVTAAHTVAMPRSLRTPAGAEPTGVTVPHPARAPPRPGPRP